MLINDVDSPPDLHLLDHFNFPPSHLEPISSLHWAATEESYTLPDLPLETEELETALASTSGERTKENSRNSRELAKVKKRKATYDKANEIREDWFRGDFDG